MKKLISFLFIINLSILLFACKTTEVASATNETAESDILEAKPLSESTELIDTLKKISNADNEFYKRGPFKKLADNFYEVTYTDYDESCINVPPTLVEVQKLFAEPGACTSVRKGNYYGRNLDFLYGDVAEILVRVPAREERYASIAMIGGFKYMTPKAIDEGYLDTLTQCILPLAVCDGINEKGVACNLNVVPVVDLELLTKGTNPEKEDLNMYLIPRFVLDNASSAKEAIELLKERNIYLPWDLFGLRAKGMDLHVMIADKVNTYVVEFVNNKMEVIDLTDNEDRIMTNFYLFLDEKTKNTAGIERFDKVKSQYVGIETMDDMKRVMESVRFSQCYGDENQNDIWYSDDHLVASDGTIITKENADRYIDEAKALSKEEQEALNEALQTKNNSEGYWITMHTSIFDLEDKTIDVCVQERYDKGYITCRIE